MHWIGLIKPFTNKSVNRYHLSHKYYYLDESTKSANFSIHFGTCIWNICVIITAKANITKFYLNKKKKSKTVVKGLWKDNENWSTLNIIFTKDNVFRRPLYRKKYIMPSIVWHVILCCLNMFAAIMCWEPSIGDTSETMAYIGW